MDNNATIQEKQKQYYENNKEIIIEKRKVYKQNNRAKILEQNKKSRERNPNRRIADSLRGRVRDLLQCKNSTQKSLDLLGCSVIYLRAWLESKFTPGMTWSNYGKWHIDHRIPCAAFNLIDPIEQRVCFHYSNLQPMWARENIIKSDNLIDIDINAEREKLTPEILTRIEELKKQEENRIIEKEEKLRDDIYLYFNHFWNYIEKQNHRDIMLAAAEPKDKIIREVIDKNKSKKLTDFYQTEEGIQNKKQAHVKRSQTMKIQKEQIRQNLVDKTCTKCKLTKIVDNFGKKSDTKDGYQPYCRQCINAIKQQIRIKNKPINEQTS
ncbi:Putative HNH endonuclease [Pacmanvirus A23]|uniref:Putative HNH endonuclease n=1 Tax=Pacmanvirus A23 TaxID=1932881 RepID=UPI000A095309|nr:Putative HNH endonuclease [Pacmanvirus A23]SIP86097.1 Putative HNH endonuclease [Pacmanvirus A23]